MKNDIYASICACKLNLLALLVKLGLNIISFRILLIEYRKVAVVGAGYIAVELAGILNALGSKVSLFIRYNKVYIKQ